MHRLAPTTALVSLALAGAGAAAATAPTTASNRAAAVADTARLVRHVRLPHGSTASAHEPRGSGLNAAPVSQATTTLVDSHAFYVVPEPVTDTQAYVRAHAPAPLTMSGQSSGPGFSKPSPEWYGFVLAARPGVLRSREVIFSFAGLSGGRTAVRVDAQDIYLLGRPPDEQVPATARVLSVTRALPGARPDVNRTITNGRTVQRMAALIDSLPITQPGVAACPSEPVSSTIPTVTFTFRARSGGPALAIATLPADSTGGICGGAVAFTIRGRTQDALDPAGGFLRHAGRVLGVTLATSP